MLERQPVQFQPIPRGLEALDFHLFLRHHGRLLVLQDARCAVAVEELCIHESALLDPVPTVGLVQ